jgi:hypothetical protein
MSRCKACNDVMSDAELENTNEHTGEPEDMCFECLAHSFEAATVDEDEDEEAIWDEIDKLIAEIEAEQSCQSQTD